MLWEHRLPPARLSLSIFSTHCQTLSQQFDVVHEKYPEAPGAAEAIDVTSRLLRADKSLSVSCLRSAPMSAESNEEDFFKISPDA